VAAASALSCRLPNSATTSTVMKIEPSAKIKIATPANGYAARTKNAHTRQAPIFCSEVEMIEVILALRCGVSADVRRANGGLSTKPMSSEISGMASAKPSTPVRNSEVNSLDEAAMYSATDSSSVAIAIVLRCGMISLARLG